LNKKAHADNRRGLFFQAQEPTCKPGSVEDDHSSGTNVAVRLKQPTREHVRAARRTPECACSPIWPCSGWGLPCHALLPGVRCALTAPFHPYLYPASRAIGGIFSAALSVGSRPPGVTWHPALRSPDFPLWHRSDLCHSDRPVDSGRIGHCLPPRFKENIH